MSMRDDVKAEFDRLLDKTEDGDLSAVEGIISALKQLGLLIDDLDTRVEQLKEAVSDVERIDGTTTAMFEQLGEIQGILGLKRTPNPHLPDNEP